MPRIRMKMGSPDGLQLDAAGGSAAYRGVAIALPSDPEARFAQMQRNHLGHGVFVFHEEEGAHVRDAFYGVRDRMHLRL
jgi:hypothetical protein